MKAPTIAPEAGKEVLEGQLITAAYIGTLESLGIAPEAPAPDAQPAPETPAADGPATPTAALDVPLEEPTTIVQLSTRGCPSDWNIAGQGDGILATNRHSNEVFEGSIAEFNEMLRG